MPTRMTGKQRAARIPLDYFKKPDRLLRWKMGLSVLALVLTFGWLASGLSFGGPRFLAENDRGRLRYSHGPVARVHATWDAKCDACHAPFASINGEEWSRKIGLRAGDTTERCATCHAVADHSNNMSEPEQNCASCHRDHRGRDASLVRLDDSDCTKCHSNLTAHRKSAGAVADKVSAFPSDHPPFRLSQSLAGQSGIKFNHALHLSPRLAQLKLENRPRNSEPGAVLACASCHRPSESGTSFEPTVYATDCKSCHPLDVRLTTPAGQREVVSIPHGLQPTAIRQQLTHAAIGVSMGPKPDPRKNPTERVELPGRFPKFSRSLPAETEIGDMVQKAERILFGPGKGTCTECHSYKASNGRIDLLLKGTSPEAVKIAAVNDVSSWFPSAKFDHAAHRGVTCQSCHQPADSQSFAPSIADMSIAGKAVCAACHAPSGFDPKWNVATGGAGHACTDCHRYHGKRHGTSASGRSIESFLRGSPTPSILPGDAR